MRMGKDLESGSPAAVIIVEALIPVWIAVAKFDICHNMALCKGVRVVC